MRSAAQSLRQQNNGRAELGAFHPDAKAKNDFSHMGTVFSMKGWELKSLHRTGGTQLSIFAATALGATLAGAMGDRVGRDLQFYLKQT